MRTVGAAMIVSPAILLSLCCLATADCDLRAFDQTLPHAIRGNVSNQFADFEWASDVDTVYDRQWVWHYILNRRQDKGLGALWEKAEIRIPLLRPLPPGKAFCNHFLADAVQDKPDTNAPIIYGTNQQQQLAAIYVAEKPQKLSGTASRISTSYEDEDGKPVSVNVNFETFQSGDGLYISLAISPGLVVGIAGLPRALSEDQWTTLQNAVKKQTGGVVTRATFAQFTDSDPGKALAGLFRPDELNVKEEFGFFSGPPGKFEIPVKGPLQKVSTNLIVFDQKRQPIMASDVSLLVPVKQ
jgi:hypothetical protein